jgi:hypothetical protein
MDESTHVLRRLELIETLEQGRASRPRLLSELRALVREAEAWARAEGDSRAQPTVSKLRKGAEGMS